MTLLKQISIYQKACKDGQPNSCRLYKDIILRARNTGTSRQRQQAQYDCATYRRFDKDWGFDHVTTSPHYASSNGFVERQIQTVKKTLTKAKETGHDPKLALLTLQSTPIDSQLSSLDHGSTCQDPGPYVKMLKPWSSD